METVWMWCWIGLGAYALRFVFYGISTTLSHISAYTILENIFKSGPAFDESASGNGLGGISES